LVHNHGPDVRFFKTQRRDTVLDLETFYAHEIHIGRILDFNVAVVLKKLLLIIGLDRDFLQQIFEEKPHIIIEVIIQCILMAVLTQ